MGGFNIFLGFYKILFKIVRVYFEEFDMLIVKFIIKRIYEVLKNISGK